MVSTRAANVDDATESIALLRRSITELCVADHQDDESTLRAWLQNKTTERFARWLAEPNNRVIVAEHEGAIVGVGCIHSGGEIRVCYVLPGFQAIGVGRALLAQLEDHARTWRLTRVHLASTANARAFYERAGYHASGPAEPGFGISLRFPYDKHL